MGDKDTVEKFLDNNPQFAKEYFDKKVKADVITAAFNNQVQVTDPTSYKDATSIQEAQFIFELVKEMQTTGPFEKQLHKVSAGEELSTFCLTRFDLEIILQMSERTNIYSKFAAHFHDFQK